MVGQPAVDQLLKRPGGFTELTQPDHPRAAFESVESAPQHGELRDVVRLNREIGVGLPRLSYHLASLFKENILQIIFFEICRCGFTDQRGRLRHYRGGQRRQRNGGCAVVRPRNRQCSLSGISGQRGLIGQRCMSGERIQPDAKIVTRLRASGLLHHGHQFLRQHILLSRDGLWGIRCALRAAHHGFQLAPVVVIDKELLCQRGLVIEHVNQEAQGSQVVAKVLKCSGATHQLLVDFGVEHLLNTALHVQNRPGGLVKTQHRKHAAHLGQLAGHRLQGGFVLGVAKKDVQRFFKLAQRHPQFAHHTAHGLFVTDTAVELLHPAFQRLGLTSRADCFQTLRQVAGPDGQLGIVGVQIFEGSLQVKHRGCDLHGQFDPRRLRGSGGAVDCAAQGLREKLAWRVQLHKGIGHQAELIGYQFEFADVAGRKRGPAFLGRGDALARLRQQGRVKAPKLHELVIHGFGSCKTVRRPDSRKNGVITMV